MDDHRYSTFALDLYWAAPDTRDPDLEQHLATCERCHAYVDHLAAIDRPIEVRARPKRPKRSWLPTLLATALAIALVIVVLAWPGHRAPRIAIKGEPGVEVLVHRGAETVVWNTSLRVRAHDALALRVACEGMARVSVLVPDATGWHLAFEGSCQDEVLPFTLVVDDQPGVEQISVVLSQSQLDVDAVQRATALETRSAALWTTRFTFAKETP
ncbi:MAG: hypothetical protein ABI437_05425 [Kofleriaceae bacterium]